MKRLVGALLLLVMALGAAYVVAQTSTYSPRTERWHFRNGILLGNDTVPNTGAVSIVPVVFCAELAENGTIFGGPIPVTTPQPALDATACDTLTSATETSADARIFPAGAATVRPLRMSCITAATLGAAETLTATLRDDAADYQAGGADFACGIVEAGTTCVTEAQGDTREAATSLWTMQFTEASNNADGDDGLCIVWFEVQQ